MSGPTGCASQAVAGHPNDLRGKLEPSNDPAIRAGLLADLANGRVLERFAGLHAAARQDPEQAVGVAMLDHQDAATPGHDHPDARRLSGHPRGRRGDEQGGQRRDDRGERVPAAACRAGRRCRDDGPRPEQEQVVVAVGVGHAEELDGDRDQAGGASSHNVARWGGVRPRCA